MEKEKLFLINYYNEQHKSSKSFKNNKVNDFEFFDKITNYIVDEIENKNIKINPKFYYRRMKTLETINHQKENENLYKIPQDPKDKSKNSS